MVGRRAAPRARSHEDGPSATIEAALSLIPALMASPDPIFREVHSEDDLREFTLADGGRLLSGRQTDPGRAVDAS